MKLLVTGASGLVGRAVTRRALAQGHAVVALGRPGFAGRVPEGASILQGEPSEWPALLAAQGFDAAIHLAAAGVLPGARTPKALVEGNAGLVAALVPALQGSLAGRLVHVGSVAEYAPLPSPERLRERDPLGPTSDYGAAKAGATLLAQALAPRHGVKLCVARLFSLYGAEEAKTRLVPAIVTALRRGETPALTPGDHVRDFTFVEDAAEALLRLALAPAELPPVVNVCRGEPVSIAEVARGVAAALGTPDVELGLGRRQNRADEPAWLVGDPALLRAALGWVPPTSLREGLQRTVAALGGAR